MATLNETFGFGPESVYYCGSRNTDETTGHRVVKILSNLPDTIRANLPYLAQEQLREILYKHSIVDRTASWSVELSEGPGLWVIGGYETADGKEYVPIDHITFRTRIAKRDEDGNLVGDIFYGIIIKGEDLSQKIDAIIEDTPGAAQGLWQSWIYNAPSYIEPQGESTLEEAILRLEKKGHEKQLEKE